MPLRSARSCSPGPRTRSRTLPGGRRRAGGDRESPGKGMVRCSGRFAATMPSALSTALLNAICAAMASARVAGKKKRRPRLTIGTRSAPSTGSVSSRHQRRRRCASSTASPRPHSPRKQQRRGERRENDASHDFPSVFPNDYRCARAAAPQLSEAASGHALHNPYIGI